ncbi:MAG: hypothetical protein HW389_1215 [Bacteroidetes bacterium]|nr:hypothetical protein [Bacteroidota bacterium]
MDNDDKNLRLGCTILAIGYIGLFLASIAIVSKQADPSSAVGRHLWAGALANACLAAVEIIIVSVPLRKKQRWAWWAASLPILFYGLPILIIDSTYVSSERLAETLAPQVLGLLAAIVGLALVARSIFSRKPTSPP